MRGKRSSIGEMRLFGMFLHDRWLAVGAGGIDASWKGRSPRGIGNTLRLQDPARYEAARELMRTATPEQVRALDRSGKAVDALEQPAALHVAPSL